MAGELISDISQVRLEGKQSIADLALAVDSSEIDPTTRTPEKRQSLRSEIG
jgi:hypothetical protein